MAAWIRYRFSDAQHALTTIVVSSVSLGTVGFLLVVGGVIASR